MNTVLLRLKITDRYGRMVKSKKALKPNKEDRACTVCGKKLSKYNKEETCFSCPKY